MNCMRKAVSRVLREFKEIIVEKMDGKNPVTVAVITNDTISAANDYRVRVVQDVFVPEDSDGVRGSRLSNSIVSVPAIPE